jgi:FKBP-type peptidyl-prolyl cis-trans isomerase FklB
MLNWKALVAASCLATAAWVYAQEAEPKAEKPAGDAELTVKQKASYGVGFSIATNLKRQGFTEIDLEQLAAGFADVYGKKEARLSPEDFQDAIPAFLQTLREKLAESNRAAGEAFLEANKAMEGVKTLPSGLQYKVLVEGKGASPKETDTVTTNYQGTLIDGEVFDSSYKRGEPASFPVNRVIKGWSEALQLMKVGSKWRLFIPSDLAYGATPPQGSSIGPNSVLIFDVELLGIEE